MEPEEAIDLIKMLPVGSRYMTSLSPEHAWSDEYSALMDIKELITWCLMRLSGYSDELPEIVHRPWQVARRAAQAKQASAKAKQVKEKLNNGNWEAV